MRGYTNPAFKLGAFPKLPEGTKARAVSEAPTKKYWRSRGDTQNLATMAALPLPPDDGLRVIVYDAGQSRLRLHQKRTMIRLSLICTIAPVEEQERAQTADVQGEAAELQVWWSFPRSSLEHLSIAVAFLDWRLPVRAE